MGAVGGKSRPVNPDSTERDALRHEQSADGNPAPLRLSLSRRSGGILSTGFTRATSICGEVAAGALGVHIVADYKSGDDNRTRP